MLYRDGLIYVANFNGADGFRIIVLDTDLYFVHSFVTSAEFAGPTRFIRTIKGPITFADENDSDTDRIIHASM